MSAPSVTYTFTNGTTADGSQVNQNFTDVLNGISDGSKDLTINDFTANGNVILGSSTADSLVINADLSSSITLNTTFTYDIGEATVGLRDLYLGSADSAARTTKIRGATVASSYTLTTPTSGGTSRFRTLTDGSGGLSFEEVRDSRHINNLALTASVGSSALTIALKGANGSDPSATNVAEVAFRSATAATGTPVYRSATSATSLVISSGSTLGHVSATNEFIYVYALDNAGTIELAATTTRIDEGTRQSTTAEGGAGASDSRTVIYSTTARSNVGMRLIGRLKSNQATAGTWATAISEISLYSNSDYTQELSQVIGDSPNGHGSTNTAIRRWSNSTTIGSAITYADSATDGMTLTINEAGLYLITYSDGRSGNTAAHGISVNSNQLTSNITGITTAHRLMSNANTPADAILCVSAMARLIPGDIVRTHTDTTNNITAASAQFRIHKMSE